MNQNSQAGTGFEVGILTTVLKTPDNVKIIMPNSPIMGGSITKFSAYDTRRSDMTEGVCYGDDLNNAIAGLSIPFPQRNIHVYQENAS